MINHTLSGVHTQILLQLCTTRAVPLCAVVFGAALSRCARGDRSPSRHLKHNPPPPPLNMQHATFGYPGCILHSMDVQWTNGLVGLPYDSNARVMTIGTYSKQQVVSSTSSLGSAVSAGDNPTHRAGPGVVRSPPRTVNGHESTALISWTFCGAYLP